MSRTEASKPRPVRLGDQPFRRLAAFRLVGRIGRDRLDAHQIEKPVEARREIVVRAGENAGRVCHVRILLVVGRNLDKAIAVGFKRNIFDPVNRWTRGAEHHDWRIVRCGSCLLAIAMRIYSSISSRSKCAETGEAATDRRASARTPCASPPPSLCCLVGQEYLLRAFVGRMLVGVRSVHRAPCATSVLAIVACSMSRRSSSCFCVSPSSLHSSRRIGKLTGRKAELLASLPAARGKTFRQETGQIGRRIHPVECHECGYARQVGQDKLHLGRWTSGRPILRRILR